MLPMHIHQLPELADLPLLQRRLALPAKFLDKMQIVDHLAFAVFAFVILFFQDGGSIARITGKEQQQVILQLVQRFRRNFQRPGFDGVVRQKAETGQAAIRGDILILLADRFPQTVDFDIASLLRQLIRMDQVPLRRMQRPQQPGRKTAGRSQAGSRRDIGHTGNFQVGVHNTERPHTFANDRMLNLRHRIDLFHF